MNVKRIRLKVYALQLGHNQLSHANRILMKDLVFYYLKTLGLNICCKCKKPLKREDFTIDHIQSWRNKPNAKELFFSIDNIGFSHFTCNSSHSAYNKLEDKPHGHSMYSKGCRCDICKEGHRLRISNRRKLGKMK